MYTSEDVEGMREWNRHVFTICHETTDCLRSLHSQSFVISRTFCQLFIVCFLRRIVFDVACVMQNANSKLESHSVVHCHVILDANSKTSCIILRIHETRPRRAHTHISGNCFSTRRNAIEDDNDNRKPEREGGQKCGKSKPTHNVNTLPDVYA